MKELNVIPVARDIRGHMPQLAQSKIGHTEKKYPDISDTLKRERTTTLILLYDTPEQLNTVLHFMDPVTVSHREGPGLFGEQKRSYITVQV